MSAAASAQAGTGGADEQPVLVIVEVSKVHDAAAMQAYQAGARAQLPGRGGVVIARGGSPVEGEPPFATLLVQRWPSARAFLDWQASDEYAPLRAMRERCASMRIAVVPLVAGTPPG